MVSHATHDPDQGVVDFAMLPPELLQVVGGMLTSVELREARLVCQGWAKTLAHCMPAVTVALPKQASACIFRQPLVLCSNGVLNSAQCQDYSAVPRSCPKPGSQPLLGRRRSCRFSLEGCSSCKRACTAGSSSARTPCLAVQHRASAAGLSSGSSLQPAPRDKPSPFATELGQSVLDCLLEDPLLASAKGAAAAAATAAGPAALVTSLHGIAPVLPRMAAIKAAISLPPMLVQHAAAMPHEQPAIQSDQHHMRKLSSLPASNAHPLPRTRNSSKQLAAGPPEQQLPGGKHHVITTAGPALQGWSSLPSAGLRTCSSLKQLHLKLSGAPPSPADLLDLSKLLHLTHLSFKQVDVPDAEGVEQTSDGEDPCDDEVVSFTSGAADSSSDICSDDDSVFVQAAASTAELAGAPGAAGMDAAASGSRRRGYRAAAVQLHPRSTGDAHTAAAAAAVTDALEHCHLYNPPAGAVQVQCHHVASQRELNAFLLPAQPGSALQRGDEGVQVGLASLGAVAAASDDWAGRDVAGDDAVRDQDADQEAELVPSHRVSCSVITTEHVHALAQLPFLSSLELAPKHGVWDAAGREGLVHLGRLTSLTRLTITWGDAAAAWAPLSAEDAAAAAHGEQLPLQHCLVGLTSLQELAVKGAAVIDVAVLQRLQQLRSLTGEALQVVNTDVMRVIEAARQSLEGAGRAAAGDARAAQQQHSAQPLLTSFSSAPAGLGVQQQQAGGPAMAAGASTTAAAQQRASRWAALPELRHVHAVHPASNISLLLQATLTPQLTHLGFVTRGPLDFSRLLGQHGKLRTLHLAFAEEESWHPIAVVRLPTALPSLHSLTIDGQFWLPNSLIVALGVMEVPLEHLSLTCRLAAPCLQRLQHLKRLKRLALHHVPGSASKPLAGNGNDTMLQLPAKLLPPQLQELEISNGWILH